MIAFPKGRALTEAVFSVAIILACGAVYRASLDLPPAMLEPVGPAAFPKAVSLILGALALVVLVGAVMRPPGTGKPGASGDRNRPGLAALTIVLTFLYLGVMQAGLLGFREASVLYLFALGAVLVDFDRARTVIVAVIALALGIGSHFLFTRFFFLDLP